MQKQGHFKIEDWPPTHPGGVDGTGRAAWASMEKGLHEVGRQPNLHQVVEVQNFSVCLFMFLYVVSVCAFMKNSCYLGFVRLSKTVNWHLPFIPENSWLPSLQAHLSFQYFLPLWMPIKCMWSLLNISYIYNMCVYKCKIYLYVFPSFKLISE